MTAKKKFLSSRIFFVFSFFAALRSLELLFDNNNNRNIINRERENKLWKQNWWDKIILHFALFFFNFLKDGINLKKFQPDLLESVLLRL